MDKETLYTEYIINGLNAKEIAEKYNTTLSIIKHTLIKYDIRRETKTLPTEEELKTLYITNNMSRKEIADKYNISEAYVKTLIKKYNLIKDMDKRYDNVQKTMMRKYGIKSAGESKEFHKRQKEKMLQKYGYENASQVKEIKERATNTFLIKYGADNKENNDYQSVRDKTLSTMTRLYGVPYALQSNYFKEKAKQICLHRYNNAVYNNREQTRQTCLEKYNVEWSCLTDNCMASMTSKNSKPNLAFAKLLDDNQIQYEREYRILNRSYDFKVNNQLIEINPTPTHNSSFGIRDNPPLDKSYHMSKSELAKENGLTCIHIFDWEDPKKILSLVQNKTRIYARKCEVKEVDAQSCKDFINDNHIQGTCYGQTIRLGLYYNNNLIEIMTFGKPRYNKNYDYELLRLCTKNGYTVIGGASKLFKHFRDQYEGSVISYCDNSKFSGNVYKELGFKLQSRGTPTRHWYNIKTNVHITDNLLRQRGFDQLFKTNYGKGVSNEELMIIHGFVEIYDCGQSTWIMEKEKK